MSGSEMSGPPMAGSAPPGPWVPGPATRDPLSDGWWDTPHVPLWSPPRRSRATLWWTLGVGGGLLLAGLALGLALDLDQDGISTAAELGSSRFWDADTDDDGLDDGWERSRGLDVRSPDSDGDTVPDGEEVQRRGDPLAWDSDRDGVDDRDEPTQDCDLDGHDAIADPDDDGDFLLDGDEEVATRCLADADGDGLRDGEEGARRCITRTDCDLDGLPDATEVEAGWDPLDPDTFDTGILDAVTYVLAQAGQSPSGDDDADGIPDAWETSDGLIDWGPFTPRPGQRDLLVEFVRVQGPDSSPHADVLPFDDAYDAVQRMFAGEGIVLDWTETVVHTSREQRPGWIDTDLDYYLRVLDESRGGDNPYVTSVVLLPQTLQRDVGDILGASFLRQMLAAVDYGVHSTVLFHDDDGDVYGISPGVESHIASGDLAFIRAQGFDSGTQRTDGTYVLRSDPFGSTPGFRIEWLGEWFQSDIDLIVDGGGTHTLTYEGTFLDAPELATTIAHELGHTFGLCHTHEFECYRDLPDGQRPLRDTSTMSYNAPNGTLRFLPAEWRLVLEVMQCPPEAPLTLVADGADAFDVMVEKYVPADAFDGARSCTDREAVPVDLLPVPDAAAYAWSYGDAPGPPRAGYAVWFGVAVLVVVAAGTTTAGIVAARITRRGL